jgi:hypothetical protein
MDTPDDLLTQENLDSYGSMSSETGSSVNVSAPSLDEVRYALCNLSHYASLPLCNGSISAIDDYGKTDYSLGFNMTRNIEIIVPIIFGLIVFVGFIGNALVVVVVAANQQMRNTTNLLIINLALADLLFIVFCVPFTATDYAQPFWPFGDVWCKIVQVIC